MNMKTIKPLYRSADGRVWWIDEGHPLTTAASAITRCVEGGHLMHTCVWGREQLTRIVTQFQVGTTYYTRSIGDHNCIYKLSVISRTAKTIRALVDAGEFKTLRVSIY